MTGRRERDYTSTECSNELCFNVVPINNPVSVNQIQLDTYYIFLCNVDKVSLKINNNNSNKLLMKSQGNYSCIILIEHVAFNEMLHHV